MAFSILDHIEKLEQTKTKGRYLCPGGCGGNNFTVSKDGKFKCWNGCESKAIMDALAPLEMPPPPPTKAARSHKSREWIFTDADGGNLIKVLRKDTPGGKRIWQEFWHEGKWCKANDTPDEAKNNAYATVAPLGYSELKQLKGTPTPVFLAEGESTADALRKIGIVATTFIKNSRNTTPLLDGLNLVICPDADKPGIDAAESWERTYPKAPWAYAYPDNPVWQNLPKGGGVDFADWIADGATAEQVLATILPPGGRLHRTEQPKDEPAEKTAKPKPSKVAATLREKYQDRLAFNTQSEQWLFYDHTKPGLWDIIPDAELESIIQAELDGWAGLEDGYSMGFVSSVVGLLRGRLNRFSWDEQPGLLPFSNGVYDLATGKLLPHAPGYGFTWQLPRPYSVIAPGPLASICPQISAWLHEATGESESLQQILLCWLNAILKSRADLQKFVHLVGPGGTGKGTFLRLATMLIGECNTHSSALDVLNQDKFEVANLVGKRLVTFSDEDKYSGRLGIFKSITGGDLLRAEQKHKTAYPFRFQGLAMVASNYPIFAGDTSSGLHRRVLTVPFTVQCPPHKRRNLDVEFEPELAAFTTYLLAIDDATVTQTLLGINDQSPEVVELSWEMRMRVDSLAAWLNECVVKRPANEGFYELVGGDTEDDSTLFGNYYQWCKRTGSRPVGLKEFSPRLIDLCVSVIGWADVERKRLTTGEAKGRTVITGLQLRKESSTHPCPIDALIEAARVKSEGSSEGSVKDRVKAETLDKQDGEGCTGSNQLYGAKNKNTVSNAVIPPETTNNNADEDSDSKKSEDHPVHPSPLGTARDSAFTAPFTQPSPHPSPEKPTHRHTRTKKTGRIVEMDGASWALVQWCDGGPLGIVPIDDLEAIA